MTEVMTAKEYRELMKRSRIPARQNKFANKPCLVDGIRFASRLEGSRYQQLKLLVRSAQAFDLKLQPRFALKGTDGSVLCEYVGDFEYTELHIIAGSPASRIVKRVVVEDTKGIPTPVYKLKIKLFKDQYPDIVFREVYRAR